MRRCYFCCLPGHPVDLHCDVPAADRAHDAIWRWDWLVHLGLVSAPAWFRRGGGGRAGNPADAWF